MLACRKAILALARFVSMQIAIANSLEDLTTFSAATGNWLSTLARSTRPRMISRGGATPWTSMAPFISQACRKPRTISDKITNSSSLISRSYSSPCSRTRTSCRPCKGRIQAAHRAHSSTSPSTSSSMPTATIRSKRSFRSSEMISNRPRTSGSRKPPSTRSTMPQTSTRISTPPPLSNSTSSRCSSSRSSSKTSRSR